MKLISSILSLDESWKLRIHITQISLIVLAIILSIGRVTIRNPPATRANTVAITMRIKSLLVIAYQFLTEHRARFRKWASTKTNAILNSVEVVFFWLAVLVVTGMGVGRANGTAAALSALTLILAVVLELFSIWMAGCSIKVHRRAKASAKYNVSAAAPTYVHSRLKSHAYPPPAMQERGYGA